MKTLFIEARYENPIEIGKEIADKLQGRIGLVSSIQFVNRLSLIKQSLSVNKKIKKIIIAGQVLGCNAKNAEKIKNRVDSFLYIGDGHFHSLGVALATKKPVFQYNPLNKLLSRVDDEDVIVYQKRRQGAMLKFLTADNIGIIVSTKLRQYYSIKNLEWLKNKYPQKKFYTFIAETIDYKQLENFPFVQAWVNTACPRIEEDIKVINIDEIN